MTRTPTRLGTTLDRRNYEWLLSYDEELAADIEAEIQAGVSPDAIGRYMLNHIGADRTALVSRCVSAARHLQASQK